MRARRSQPANRGEYDGFDLPPPEVYDAPPEAPVDELPTEAVMASGPSLHAPLHVCLVCGDDPSLDSGCPHFEVATVTALSVTLHHALAELRSQHEALRDGLRMLRRLAGAAVAVGDATLELREPPVPAPRVVLIPPPPAKRPRRPDRTPVGQGRFGFVEAPPASVPAGPPSRDRPTGG